MAHPEVAPVDTERGRFLSRAAEAKAFVARVAPELLNDNTGVDVTLVDAQLALTVEERLHWAEDFARGVTWLRSLPRVRAT